MWRKLNITTLLILPLFDDIVQGIKTRLTPRIEFPFLQLACEYGLIKAYLFKEGDIDTTFIYVVFTEKVLENLKLTNSKYHSLSERIIDSKYYIGVERNEDHVIFKLRIPEEYRNDILLITKGHYSKVSSKYKMALKIKQKTIPRSKNPLGRYVVKQNLPYSIVTKQKHLKADMIEALGQDFSSVQEFYPPFEMKRETLVYETYGFIG